MKIELEVWQLITLLLTFFGAVGAFGRLLLTQIDQRMADRFQALTDAQQRDQKHIDARFERLENGHRERERDLLELRAELPRSYVRREDQIRETSLISTKIDALATKVELLTERTLTRGT